MRKHSDWKSYFQNSWFLFLTLAFVAGILLRVTYVNDMEYKEDEEYNFNQTQWIGTTQPWPWYGIASGVYLVNPGMSIWVFTVLAKIFGIHRPTDLATAVQLFALLGMSLIIPFALKLVPSQDKKTWFWAFALAMVNPFLVLYQRKLWPEPFLPFFTMITLMGWWTRKRRLGAFIWGMIGAWLGQIHMSGFFFSAALFLWTLFFDSGSHRSQNTKRNVQHSSVSNMSIRCFFARLLGKTNWIFWFLGSVAGALPLVPWLIYIIQHPIQQSMSAGWNEIIQLKYWAFWFTDPLGLHLGNPLGLLRGSNLAQISDFIRYPLLAGHPTYLVGLAHICAAGAALCIMIQGLMGLWRTRNNWKRIFIGKDSETAFVQNSALIGCGLLLTATGVVIRRYYMAVTFPLEFICLVRMANPSSRLGHKTLTVLWIAELFISANFVGYIHVNQGSVYGDYGPAYRTLQHSETRAIQ